MRAPHKFGRILLLLSLVLGLNALYSNALAPHWHFAHVPRGGHGHYPAQRSHRLSGRARRSQNWDVPDTGVADELQAHRASVASSVASADAPGFPAHQAVPVHDDAALLPAAALPFDPAAATEPLDGAPILAVGSPPRAPGSARGPPLS